MMNKFLLSLLAGLFTVLISLAQETAKTPVFSLEEETIFQVVEQMPIFPGGMPGLSQYLSSTLRYPGEAQEAKVQGTVFVGFVVDKTGVIRDVTMLKGIGHGCDEEAMRVIQLMPAWTPGRQDGRQVSVRFTIPIRFIL
jgi:protein TonB